MRHELIALALASLACTTQAQTGLGSNEFAPNKVWRGSEDGEEKPWEEAKTPLPTTLRTQGLISIDVSATTLRFGVDPQSVSIGDDGVIRYVVVATSPSGAVNAMQEGVRCITSEVKTYARYAPGSGWAAATGSGWNRLSAHTPLTRHSAAIARGGLCIAARLPQQRSVADVVRDLRSPPDMNYTP